MLLPPAPRRQEAAACLLERPSWAHKGGGAPFLGGPLAWSQGLGAGSAALEGRSLDALARGSPAPAAQQLLRLRLQPCRPSAPSLRGPRAQRSRSPAVGGAGSAPLLPGLDLSVPLSVCPGACAPRRAVCAQPAALRGPQTPPRAKNLENVRGRGTPWGAR